jgi:photosystem II stability/assembly factor-like uncharacterized protein
LWVAGIDGTVRQLAAALPLPASWPYDPGMVWSPGSSSALILAGSWAWLVYPPLAPGQPVSLTHIAMLDTSNGWGQTTSGHIIRTGDGGQTWSDVTPMDTALFYYQDADSAWAASAGGDSAWETADGGQSWQPSPKKQADISVAWRTWPKPGSEYFLNLDQGWRVAEGQLQHTLDGGQTWVALKTIAWESAQFSFVDEHNGWAIVTSGEDSALVHTTDGGITWEVIEPVVRK